MRRWPLPPRQVTCNTLDDRTYYRGAADFIEEYIALVGHAHYQPVPFTLASLSIVAVFAYIGFKTGVVHTRTFTIPIMQDIL